MSIQLEKHIPIHDDALNAIDVLASSTGLSKQRIKLAMKKGAVWIERDKQEVQRLRRSKKALKQGDTLHLYYNEDVLNTLPERSELIADESAYSIWYKPYGVLSQGSKWGDHCTINRWVEEYLRYQRPVFIVHRLDKAASGLMLLAHKKQTTAQLAELFKNRQIEKIYQVIVHGHFPSGTQTIDSPIEERSALSHANLIHYDEKKDRSLVEIKIETDRKHQIRRHLQELGFPVVGDRLYGKEEDQEDLQLCSYSLAFTCPISQESKSFKLPLEKQLVMTR